MNPPESLPDRPMLRQLAGEKVFAQGETYFNEGRVRQLRPGPDRASARVEGKSSCRVKLWQARGELQWSCTCPVGREATLCKHAVALGLAWLASLNHKEGKSSTHHTQRQEEGRRELIHQHLATLDQERLIALLLEATDFDDILHRRLLLESIGVVHPKAKGKRRGRASAPQPDLTAYQQILREAIEVRDYVDYEAMPDYAQGVEEAVAPLDGLLHAGHANAVIELVETALIALDAAAEFLDGGDGSLNRVYDELQRLHYEACRVGSPDVEWLAARLFSYELEGGLGVFGNVVNNYAEVLGEPGLRAWRKLLETRWTEIAEPDASAPGARPIDHRRYQLQAMMENLAAAEGNVDRLIEIKERDLSSPYDFLSLAQLCRSAGRHAEAANWAERGIRKFPAAGDHAGLRDFLPAPNAVRS